MQKSRGSGVFPIINLLFTWCELATSVVMLLVCAKRVMHMEFDVTLYDIYLYLLEYIILAGEGGGATLLQLILFVRCILDGFYFWSLSFPPTGENFAINKATFYVYESCSMCLIPIYTYISSIVPRSTHSVNFYLLKGHDHTMGTRKKFTLTGCRKSFSIIHFIKRHRFHMFRDIILSNWFNCLIVGISFIINYVNHYYTYTIL